MGGCVANQAEAEFAREQVVPAPLHGTALGGNGAVKVHGLDQQERRGRLVQAEDLSGRLAGVRVVRAANRRGRLSGPPPAWPGSDVSFF
jgi:hypothetical protein